MPDRFTQLNMQERIDYGKRMLKNGWTVEYSQDPKHSGEDYKWTHPDGTTYQSRFSDLPPGPAVERALHEGFDPEEETSKEVSPEEEKTEEKESE